MPPIGYVAAVWASLNRPCPHVLFTLIAHVLKVPKMKNLAAALPIELQVDVARDAVEQDADAMDSNRTLLKQGVTPPFSFVTSTPPLKNNPVASVVPVPGLDSVLGTEILGSFTSPHSRPLLPVLHEPVATKVKLPLLSHAAPVPLHDH